MKIKTVADIIPIIDSWRRINTKTVLVTGVFDILHIEHLRFLKAAKDVGDKLLVGIESDYRVQQIKGKQRPINNQEIRLEQLSHVKYVDLAFLLPQEFSQQADWESFMGTIRPNVYAVSESSRHLENKEKIAQKFNVEFKIVHPHNPDFSTTKFFEKLVNDYAD